MPPCRFFNSPGGCRKGTACNFAHSTLPALAANGTNSRSSDPSHASSRHSKFAGIPAGMCSFYWTSGKCNREFNCRFRHEHNPELSKKSSSPSSFSTDDRTQGGIDVIAPFLTDAGLAKLGVSGTDAFFASPSKTMSPVEAHNALRLYLRDDYRFSKTFYIYGFLIPLNNATTSNASWVSSL